MERPSKGCLRDDEAIVIRLPHLFLCISGRVPGNYMVLIRSWSSAAPGFRRGILKDIRRKRAQIGNADTQSPKA